MTLQSFLLLSTFLPPYSTILDRARCGLGVTFFDDLFSVLENGGWAFLDLPAFRCIFLCDITSILFSSCLYTYLIHYHVYHLSFILPLAIDEHFFHIQFLNLVHSLIIGKMYILQLNNLMVGYISILLENGPWDSPGLRSSIPFFI